MGVELKKYRYEFILNDGDHLQEACYGIPCFKIFPFYELDFRGRGQKVLGYEIAELHRSVDKEREFFYALRFDTICEARFFLALFKWLLNHDFSAGRDVSTTTSWLGLSARRLNHSRKILSRWQIRPRTNPTPKFHRRLNITESSRTTSPRRRGVGGLKIPGVRPAASR